MRLHSESPTTGNNRPQRGIRAPSCPKESEVNHIERVDIEAERVERFKRVGSGWKVQQARRDG